MYLTTDRSRSKDVYILKSNDLFQSDCLEVVAPGMKPSSLQARLPSLTRKMRKMCVRLVKKAPLPELSEDLDQFTGNAC